MTVLERLLCSLGLHSWQTIEGARRVSAVCARNPAHRRLLEITPAAWGRGFESLGRTEPAPNPHRLVVLEPGQADISEDKIAPPEAEIESAPATILVSTPAAIIPVASPPTAPPRGGWQPSTVPCVPGFKLHKWRVPHDDGWYRCERGCGAGRKGPTGAVVAEGVPPSSEGAPTAGKASTPTDDSEDGPADEEIIYRPEPAPAIVELPKFDKSTIAGDADDYGDFGEPASVEAPERLESDSEDDLDGGDDVEGIVRPRAGVAPVPREEIARLAGRDDTPHLGKRAPCPRCQVGTLARDSLEPNDPTAYACVSCGHRPTLSAEQARELERDFDMGGKLRRRQPPHAGARM